MVLIMNGYTWSIRHLLIFTITHMINDKSLIPFYETPDIHKLIHTIRGEQVILDKDLAELYEVKAIHLRQQIKRNLQRFPLDFMFKLSKNEINNMVSQNVIPSKQALGGHLPYVFTEQGVAGLSAVLTSQKAIDVNIQIIRAFVQMRKLLIANSHILYKLNDLEQNQIDYKLETDKQFSQVFKALETQNPIPKQGVFFEGQVFDAYQLVQKIIKSAKTSIILVDNYINADTLQIFNKRQKGTTCDIYTSTITDKLSLTLKKYNAQYQDISLYKFKKAHDRFLIIDKTIVYHFGASLKDLGKKWFAFSKLDIENTKILDRLLMAK